MQICWRERKKVTIQSLCQKRVKTNNIFKAVGSKHIKYPSTKECTDKYDSNIYTDEVSYKKRDRDLIMQGKTF